MTRRSFYNNEMHSTDGRIVYDVPGEEEMEEKKADTNVNEAVEVLKEEFGKRRRVKDGTVIRFVMLDKYTYAAVYVAGKWYITGTGKWWGTNIFEHDDFVKAIGAATKMEVATEWEELE